jgi:tripartite ATP-independent transporter DctM subunit
MASTYPFANIVDTARRLEDALAATAIGAMAALPMIESVLRWLFGTGIPGASAYVESLTLWVAYLGAMVASRDRRHLDFSSALPKLPAAMRQPAAIFAALVSTCVIAGLAWASFDFVRSETDVPTMIGGWLSAAATEAILPIAFSVMALRVAVQVESRLGRILAVLGIPAAAVLGFLLTPYAGSLLWPGIFVLIASVLLGAPIFIAVGGAALLLFFAEGVPVAAIPVETYRVVVSPTLPTVPLFTLAGYLLAESDASFRLVRLFRAWVGWLPGGPAIVVTLLCAFFSTFTGASGVTILALGGLLVPTLMTYGYGENLALGLVTSTGSIGQLFPPSLAIILYGVIAHVPIPDLFVAGLVPGLLMVAAVGGFAVLRGPKASAERSGFDTREAIAALWDAKWELFVPAVALFGIFGGFSTLTEAAATTVVYVFFVECVIHRDIHPVRDLPRVLVKSVSLIGGVFVILGVSMGLTNYLVDAEIPAQAAAWVAANIESRFVFLLALNLFLLVIGCLDGFSAIIIAVPLVQPIAAVFHIHPLHLAMIFLVNLELGYLAPPLGMNLLLASYRFERPLSTICRATGPFGIVLLAVLMLVTYWPGIIIGVP